MAAQLKKYLFPAFYVLIMVIVVLYAFHEQVDRRSGSSPLYRNLMDNQAFIKRGFDPSDILKIPAPQDNGWHETNNLRVMYSPLPDLPKRKFLSLKTNPAEEFTIIIPIEFDNRSISFLNTHPYVIPGICFAVIGENWEIFLNGSVIQSEIHLEEENTIIIKENRTWWNVYFPFDRNLIVSGTNILALRIIGDPSYSVTGFGYQTHHYIDDYRIIKRRQENYPLFALCCIFGFTGIYYFLLYFFIRNRREIYNLCFSIFSILLCIYTLARHSIINILIPNSDISVRLEYPSIMLLIPVFFVFIESLVWGKIRRINKIYTIYCLFLAASVIVFNNSFAEDVLDVWGISTLIYSTYFIFYKLIYLYFRDKGDQRDSSSNTHIVVAIVGSLGFCLSYLYELVELVIFRNYFSIFQYSLFAIHIGMAVYLAQSFGVMYKKNVQELEEQTAIAAELSAAKSKFITTINNDLRTPLSNIAADIQNAQEKINDAQARSQLQKIWNDTMQMAEQVSGALDELQKTKSAEDIIQIGTLSFDLVSSRAFFNGASGKIDLLLSPKEFALLYLLVRNEGKTLSAEHLYKTVWKLEYTDAANATLRAHIAYLKKKLAEITNEIIIETSRGEGYYLSKV